MVASNMSRLCTEIQTISSIYTLLTCNQSSQNLKSESVAKSGIFLGLCETQYTNLLPLIYTPSLALDDWNELETNNYINYVQPTYTHCWVKTIRKKAFQWSHPLILTTTGEFVKNICISFWYQEIRCSPMRRFLYLQCCFIIVVFLHVHLSKLCENMIPPFLNDGYIPFSPSHLLHLSTPGTIHLCFRSHPDIYELSRCCYIITFRETLMAMLP